MDERYLRWALVIPLVLLLFAVLAIIAYILIPVESIKSLLSIVAMLAIILAAVSALIPQVIATIEVAGSSRLSTGRKVLWIVVFWVLVGIIGVALYYFIDRKNTI